MKNKIIITLASIIGIAILGVSLAQANNSYILPLVSTAPATSTQIAIAPATGSSTSITLDSYVYGSAFATDRASLLVQQIASTSSSTISIAFTFSQDNIDYFGDSMTSTSTIANANDVTTTRSYTIHGNTTASTTRIAIPVPTPTRYIRATITSAIATSSVWAEFVPIRQVPSR